MGDLVSRPVHTALYGINANYKYDYAMRNGS